MTQYIIKSRVKRIERKDRVVSTHKEGERTVEVLENLGWFVQFEGSGESIYFGLTEPELQLGDPITIRIEKNNG